MSNNEFEGRPIGGLAVSEGWEVLEPGAGLESFTWFHVTPEAGLVAAVLSDRPVVYRGHYVAGNVQPCSIPICGRCRAGIGVQVRVVLSVFDVCLGQRGLLEVGQNTGVELRGLAERGGGLRGQLVKFSKEGGAQRGRILVEPYQGALEVQQLPPAQDPLVCLNSQWARLALRQAVKDGPGAGAVGLRGEATCPEPSFPSGKSSGPAKLREALIEAERKHQRSSSTGQS